MDTRRGALLLTAVAVLTLLGGVAGAVVVSGEVPAPDSSSAAIASLSAEALTASTTTTPPTTAPKPVATTSAPATTVTTTAPQPTSGIRVEASPARPKAGETVRFVVTASQPGPCCYILLEPGDGGRPAPASTPCTAGAGGQQRIEFTHIYNTPGTWTVVARADAGRACDRSQAAPPQLTTSISVVVAAGTTSSQGPAVPQVDITLVAGANGQVTVEGAVSDLDGWVSRVDVEWGDGSPATVLTQAQPCRSGTNGWPVGAPLLLRALPAGAPIGWTATPATHTYATPGPHTVKVSAVSTGCDGGTAQRATRTLS